MGIVQCVPYHTDDLVYSLQLPAEPDIWDLLLNN